MVAREDAVSPVIGVILMVAVTVVLAAVIGAFVFGIGDSLGDPAPNTQIDFTYDDDTSNIEVVHAGGDSITEQNTGELLLTGDVPEEDADGAWGDKFEQDADDDYTASPTDSVGSGDVIFDSTDGAETDGVIENDDEFELQWSSSDGGQSSTLGSYDG